MRPRLCRGRIAPVPWIVAWTTSRTGVVLSWPPPSCSTVRILFCIQEPGRHSDHANAASSPSLPASHMSEQVNQLSNWVGHEEQGRGPQVGDEIGHYRIHGGEEDADPAQEEGDGAVCAYAQDHEDRYQGPRARITQVACRGSRPSLKLVSCCIHVFSGWVVPWGEGDASKPRRQ